MLRYLIIIMALMTAWLLLIANNYAWENSPEGTAQAVMEAPHLRHLQGELGFAGSPFAAGQAVTMALDIMQVDPVEHTAVGSVTWTGDGETEASAAPRIEATVTHVFFGADEPNGDPASAVVVAQVLDAHGSVTAQRGDYVYFWLRSGDATHPAQWGIFPYSVEPRVDFFPYDRSPAPLGYFDVGALQIIDPQFPLLAEFGECTIDDSLVY